MTIYPVLAIHGGAGTISKASITPEIAKNYEQTLHKIITAGHEALQKGASALDAVSLAVSMLEDDPLFNAGRGAVYTRKATHELSASIMDGASLASGAVACVHGVKNPILAARMVMEQSESVLMVAEGAMDFLRNASTLDIAGQGIAFEPKEYFHSAKRLAQLEAAQGAGMFLDHVTPLPSVKPLSSVKPVPPLDEQTKMGTVGAVALDIQGRLAAATSTGGLTNSPAGRVGDTPIIGSGCYADATVAVSCTGEGEYFIRLCVAHDVAARMLYGGASLDVAGKATIAALTKLGGMGGLIAVDAKGSVSFPFNSEGMYRACARTNTPIFVAMYGDDA